MARSVESRLLELVGEIHGLLELDELQEGVLAALDHYVPSDWSAVNLMERDRVRIAVRPELSDAQLATFASHAHENPLAARYERTRDSRPYRFSDVITPRQLHALTLYREFYAPLGIEHQIAFIIDTGPDSYVAIALCRGDRDFTDAERDALDRARPFLVQSYRNALRHGASVRRGGDLLTDALVGAGLTPRAAAVLSRVAQGRSNAGVAAELGLSERTVGKHLQRCYRQLGVANRSQAAVAAWETHARATAEGAAKAYERSAR